MRTRLVALRAAAATATLVAAAAIGGLAFDAPAYAETLGYPNAGAPCQFGAGGGPSCTNPNDPHDAYDWYVDENGNGTYSGVSENLSPRGYYYRNCTDYVAWKLESLGVSTSLTRGRGNGNQWDDNPASVTITTTPEVGDAAVWNGGTFGHVAFVEAVRPKAGGGLEARVSEYNHSMDGTGSSTRWTQADSYIDFNGVGNPLTPVTPGVAVELVHYWQSGSGATDAVTVTPGGITAGGPTTIGAVTPNNGQFGLGDFNNDGIADLYLVVTQGDPSGHAAVFVAAGPTFTTFLATVQTPMGQFGPNHGDVVIGDFTGDGKADVGVLFSNNGSSNAAFGILNAATTFQTWSYLSTIPIGGHDGTRSDAVAGDFNHDQKLDLGIGFHQGTPSGNVDLFVLDGQSSYQSVSSYTLPLGGWTDGQGQLLSGRFGTSNDQLAVIYTPTGTSPDLFVLNGMSTVSGSWTLPVSGVPAGQRVFIGI